MVFSEGIRLLQWNCCGLRGKLPLLQTLLQNIDILCAQESLLWSRNNLWVNGFNLVRKDITSSNERGICILIRNNISFSTLDLSFISHPSVEIQGISLSLDNNPLAIINIYRHPNQYTSFSFYENLLFFLRANFTNFIIVGDLNAHHSWWGCDYDDQAGKTLSRIIDSFDLVIANDRAPTILLPPNSRNSVIDLTLISSPLSAKCTSFTDHDTVGSDHFPIYTFISGSFLKKQIFAYKLKISKKDTSLLYHNLNESISTLESLIANISNFSSVYSTFEHHIKHHVYSFFPPNARSPRHKVKRIFPSSPPWWNDECQAAVSKRRESTRAYLKHPSLANFIDYKHNRSSCTKILKKQKRLGWKKFCSQFSSKTPTSEIWSLVKSFKKRKFSQSSSFSDDSLQTQFLNDAISKLCPPSCLHVCWHSLNSFLEEDLYNPTIFKELDNPFSLSELNLAINNTNIHSAPGLDQLDYNIIASLPPEYIHILLRIYNSVFAEGSFPNQWKQSLVVLIPKPGNSGVRPISLLSCFLKIMERMIYTRLQWFIESRHILPDVQFGFRPDRSCIDNLVILSSDIHKGFINNSSTIGIFLDIKGAFDNVIPNILIKELGKIGIPAHVRRFIQNLICERHLHFVLDGNLSGPFLSFKGTPQGSTLSPILFNIYLRNIVKHLHPKTKILLYADDIVIYSTNKNIHKAHEYVQLSIDYITEYLGLLGLDLSPNKSNWMVFTRARVLPTLVPLNILGNPVPRVNAVKFLGISLDVGLSGKTHFRHLIKKGSILLDILTSLAGTWWGSHPHLLLNLYRSIFRSSIEYGCQIFNFHKNKSLFIKIQRLQFRAIRIAMGYRLSTPINVMLFESREVPLKLRFNLLIRKFLIKCFSRDFNPVTESLYSLKLAALGNSRRINLLISFPILKHFICLFHYRNTIHCSPFLPFHFFDFDVSLFAACPCFAMFPADRNLSHSEMRNLFLEKSSEYRKNAISFYTDGSKFDRDTSSGAAVFSPDLNFRIVHKLPPETSVFTAEAWAILQAVNASLDFNCSKSVIFSDSKSVLEALSSPMPPNKNYIIHIIKKRLVDAIKDNKIIHLFWIPAHSGIPGNESVDALARRAALSGFKPRFKIPFTDLFLEFKESLRKQFSEYLEEAARDTGLLHASLYQLNITPRPWYYNKPLCRNDIVLINRIRSNHYNLNYSLFRKNMTTSAACLCGDPKQDINHIIFYCPITTPKSHHLRSFLIKFFPLYPIDIFPILFNPSPKLIRLLSAFLKANDILI